MPRSAALGNPLRERFVREVLIDGHANRAALRAGYTHSRAGEKLLQIPEVIGEIKKQHRSRLRRLQLQADEVVMAWSRIARFNPTHLFDENGYLKPPKDWPEEVALCIASIEVEERFEGRGENRISFYVHKVKFNDRMAALNSLGRYHNLFADEAREAGRGIGQGISEGMSQLIEQAQQDGGGVRGLLSAAPQALPSQPEEIIVETQHAALTSLPVSTMPAEVQPAIASLIRKRPPSI